MTSLKSMIHCLRFLKSNTDSKYFCRLKMEISKHYSRCEIDNYSDQRDLQSCRFHGSYCTRSKTNSFVLLTACVRCSRGF